MPNAFDLKFIDFLKRHSLYDEKIFKFISNQSIMIDSKIDEYDFLFGSCHIAVNSKKGKLEQVIPCMLNLMDDYSVMIAIYTYIQTLLLIPRVNKTYNEDLFYHYFLPLFYKKIYILENPTDELLEYEEKMRERLLTNSPNKFQLIFNLIDELTCNYNKDRSNNSLLAKKAKRKARTYLK